MYWIKLSWLEKNYISAKNDFQSGFIFYGLYLAPKKYVLNVNECGVMQENKTFKRFNDSKRLLDRS